MFEVLIDVLLTMAGAAIAASVIAALSWMLLRWTRFPGFGPVVAFALLALKLEPGPFTQMLLLFSAMLALAGFLTIFGPVRQPKGEARSLGRPVGPTYRS